MGAVLATLTSGSTLTVDPSAGATAKDVLASLTSSSLTGSAVPFADVWLPTVEGGRIRFTEVAMLWDADRPPSPHG